MKSDGRWTVLAVIQFRGIGAFAIKAVNTLVDDL
jgi:hypothetical protein